MVDLLRDGALSTAKIAELLAPTLGWEKGSEVASAAAARLGFPPESLTVAQMMAILDDLTRTPGMVGIAARFARTRLQGPETKTATVSEPTRPPTPVSDAPPPSAPPSVGPVSAARVACTAVSADDIAALFASAMGAEKALDVVQGAARRLGLEGRTFDKAQAMSLLGYLSGEPGVIGLCARFGKARLILRFAS